MAQSKSVVITGVSTGIGHAATKVLISRGIHVFGSVRKAADGERLKAEFGEAFTPLIFDVVDEAAVRAGARQVEAALGGKTLAGLVNNAGIAVAGPLLYLPVEEFRHQLEVNLTGVLNATQTFAPLLGAGGERVSEPGRIVNISSVGGRNANPFMGPYCTTKFGLEGFSESLRRELLPFGVDVVVVAPGAVATPIWDKADQVDITRYANTPYAKALERMRGFMLSLGKSGLPPERIGETIATALTAPAPKVRYVVSPSPMQVLMTEILPKRTIDKATGKRLGLI
ncbi:MULTISPECIES: SDR family NAD(P)-dependent oxidoreductase [unclassified Caulobacter]|uniref:SDR family NAD(P)-dependent oxidoreductase n=1 Tax=unclassified Caulobacter TaxID=2648921 RepID=UPI00078282B6|nr:MULTISPECIES: SDR family NAD(P)-dependent oxidoreductase [unclassified Caulobacter]AZS20438.1 SDR family NAD(P)-dependent oxidoreductase [Caulobacter sp. FWC26]